MSDGQKRRARSGISLCRSNHTPFDVLQLALRSPHLQPAVVQLASSAAKDPDDALPPSIEDLRKRLGVMAPHVARLPRVGCDDFVRLDTRGERRAPDELPPDTEVSGGVSLRANQVGMVA